jgi:hypothetical protein
MGISEEISPKEALEHQFSVYKKNRDEMFENGKIKEKYKRLEGKFTKLAESVKQAVYKYIFDEVTAQLVYEKDGRYYLFVDENEYKKAVGNVMGPLKKAIDQMDVDEIDSVIEPARSHYLTNIWPAFTKACGQ